MSVSRNVAIGGVIVGLILLLILPSWVGAVVIAVAIGIPVAAYLMLDKSQRRRFRRNIGRKQLGR